MFPEDAQTLQMPVIVFDNSMAKQINVEPKKGQSANEKRIE